MASFFGGLRHRVYQLLADCTLIINHWSIYCCCWWDIKHVSHGLAENIQDAYAEAASIAEQVISYVMTLYAFTNETLTKYSYATSLQATLRYGILISLVQGL